MNTKLLMTFSALLLGIAGLILSFAPVEVAKAMGLTDVNAILLQLMGALYVGFAMVNWTARANLIGGIYGRPIAIGNFTHFAVGGLALLKYISNTLPSLIFWLSGLVYLIFSLFFGYVFFTHPLNKPSTKK